MNSFTFCYIKSKKMYKVKMEQVYNVGAKIGIPTVDETGVMYDTEQMQQLIDSRFRLYAAIISEITVITSRQNSLADKYKRLNKSLWRVRRELEYDNIYRFIQLNLTDLVLEHGFSRVKKLVTELSFAQLAMTEEKFKFHDDAIVDYCGHMKIYS